MSGATCYLSAKSDNVAQTHGVFLEAGVSCVLCISGGVTKLDSSFRDSIIFWDVGDEAVDED